MKKIISVPDFRSFTGRSQDHKESDYELAIKFNERYYHWEETKYRTRDESERERVWSLMKLNRRFGMKRLNIGGIECSFSITPRILDSILDLETRLSGDPNYQRGELNIETMRYSVSSFVEEAMMSSIMEGAAVTRVEAKRIIRKMEHPVTTGERMVMNNFLALENINKIKDEKLSPELIKQMHMVIADGTLKEGDEWAGKFREDNEIVVGDIFEEDKVYHVPPPYEEIQKMIAGLCDFCNKEEEEPMHPMIKGIILHFMIGYIHPFIDGNGRLARSLFYWYLLKKGYRRMEYVSISKIIGSSKERYGMAYQYTESDENDLTYFINYNMSCIQQAVDGLERYIQEKIMEKKAAILLLGKNSKLNLRQALTLNDHMDGISTFSVIELQNKYGCAYQTARTDTLSLESMGLICAVMKDGKKVLYVVDTEKVKEYCEQK